jgi:AcrR family transcriptional regulator
VTDVPGDIPADELPDPTAVTGNELAKSRATRRRILQAATALLAEQGYNRFSTGAVATRAGLSRPAMLYHFGSRRDLVAAVVNHLARRRIEMFEQAMARLADAGEPDQGHVRAAATDLNWVQLETPEFAALTELSVAARTDAELAEVVRPALASFDRSRRATSRRLFEVKDANLAEFQLVRDIVRFLTEGIVQQNSIIEDRDNRLAALRHFLHMLVASPAGAAFVKLAVETQKAPAVPDPPPGLPPGTPPGPGKSSAPG